jgi:hypothetical protein
MHYLTTVTMVSNATMETKICSLPYLRDAKDTVMLNNVRKVGELVLSRTSCLYTEICTYRTLWPSGLHSRIVFGRCRVQISARRPAILPEVSHVLPQFVHARAELNQATTASIHIISTSFITLSLDAMEAILSYLQRY